MAYPDHESVITRALNKDRDALGQLLFLRYEWLVAVARRAIPKDLRDIVDPQDVVQDASVKIFAGFDRLVPASEGSLFQWMQTITQRVAIDHLRKLSQTPPSLQSPKVDALIKELRVVDPSVSSVLQRKELSRAFMTALEKLEPNYRRTIELLYLEAKTIAEVAELMGKSEAAIRGYRHRAREKLRESIIRLSFYV